MYDACCGTTSTKYSTHKLRMILMVDPSVETNCYLLSDIHIVLFITIEDFENGEVLNYSLQMNSIPNTVVCAPSGTLETRTSFFPVVVVRSSMPSILNL